MTKKPLLPPKDPIVEGATQDVRQMFASAMGAASADIEKLFAQNGANVPMSGALRVLTVGMIELLAARVAAATKPEEPK